MRHHLALVACLAFTGTIAHAAPGRPAKIGKKAPPVEVEAAEVQDADEDEIDMEPDRVALGDEAEAEAGAEPAAELQLRDAAATRRAKDWHVAIGPYLWASSVDADVSLGPASVSSGVDFFDITRHARYGAELLAEARYGRLSIYGDLMYGVVDVGGTRELGPLMVTLNGTASSLLVDGIAGYRLTGGDHALLSVEARAGARYQRTAVSASVDVLGAEVSPERYVDAAADALAGGQVVLRPSGWASLAGTFDVGVAGASASTWSASVDASIRAGKHVRLSLGWRTLTTERTNVSITLHGPRAAVQLVF